MIKFKQLRRDMTVTAQYMSYAQKNNNLQSEIKSVAGQKWFSTSLHNHVLLVYQKLFYMAIRFNSINNKVILWILCLIMPLSRAALTNLAILIFVI